jgi:hypothetical protein
MKRKTSQRGFKHQISPLEETTGKKKSPVNSESVLKIPKLKIPELVNSPKYGKPMRNYIPQRLETYQEIE